MASFEERSAAFKAAERLQESLQTENPSFVKSMVRSHVYSCFWLVSCNEIVFLVQSANIDSCCGRNTTCFTNSCSDYKGLPSKFCEDHLPKVSDTEFVLEDEDGNECDAKFIARRAGLSGGWRGFALERKLDDGDALVFELVEPTRFKVWSIQHVYCIVTSYALYHGAYSLNSISRNYTLKLDID